MSTHEEFSLLSSYVDGELGESERAALEAHLPSCAECATTLAALRATIADLRALDEPAPDERQAWALRSAIARARKRERNRGRFTVAAGGVAAALVAVVAVVFQGQKPGTSITASELNNKSESSAIVMASDQNYDATSARGIFTLAITGPPASVGITSAGSALTDNATSGTGETYADRGLPAGQSAQRPAPEPNVPVPPVSVSEDLRACESRVLAPPHEPARALLYLYARFDGESAYFMVYEVPADSPARRELWIVRPKTCDLLRFEQQRI
jgi:hypothetical protein